MPERFSSLKELHEKLWNKAVEEENGKKKIYTQIGNYSIVEELLLPMEQQTDPHTLLLDSNEHEVPGIPWEEIKSGGVKVKANNNNNEEWWTYNPHQRAPSRGGRKKTRRKKGGKKRKTRKRKKKRKKTRRKKRKGGCYPNCCRKATRVVPARIALGDVVNTGQFPPYERRNQETRETIQRAYDQAYDPITGRPYTPWSPSQFEMIRDSEEKRHNDEVNNYINNYPQATPVSERAIPIIPRGLQQPDRVYMPGIIAPTVIVPSGSFTAGGGLFKGKSTISTNFESGNINHIKNVQRKKDVLVVLEIQDEPYPSNTKNKYQNWFYFKSNDVERKSITYTIQNIKVFGNDWKGFNVCYSYDNENWKRIKTSFSKKKKTVDSIVGRN